VTRLPMQNPRREARSDGWEWVGWRLYLPVLALRKGRRV
jgi:hypothetical protein